ncbi:MAG: tetratricopeptide repeat protein [Ktedonobacteraceae bacterium]|nr:tetratricopeptide repeat protein [Ktedonobacteraceae bacterium]MBV9021681.1 tetratricopeptide repeat protein [Ktedonobacteraceae bacterium]
MKHIGKGLHYDPFVDTDYTQVLSYFRNDDATIDYGQLVRFLRKEVFHWTAQEFGELYGNATRGKPYSRREMQESERTNTFPLDEKRRAILAVFFKVSPALFGLESLDVLIEAREIPPPRELSRVLYDGPIDLVEYRSFLLSCWTLHLRRTARELLADIELRIARLHDVLPYEIEPREKLQLGRLLCGYHLAGGMIAKDQHRFDLALSHFNKALILAREMKSPRLQAASLYRRGGVFLDWGKFAEARRDFSEAEALKDYTPPRMQGSILVARATAEALFVQDSEDTRKKVLTPVKQAHDLLGTENQDEGLHFIRFTDQGYHVDSAIALLESPIERFRYAHVAREHLDQLKGHEEGIRQQTYNLLLEAKISICTKAYDEAVQAALSAFDILKQVETGVNMQRLRQLCWELEASPYGKSTDVAWLRFQLATVGE